MQTFNASFGLRQWVLIKVSQQHAIVIGVHIRDTNTPRYDLLSVSNGVRTESTVDEYEIEALSDNTIRSFPDPFMSTAINI